MLAAARSAAVRSALLVLPVAATLVLAAGGGAATRAGGGAGGPADPAAGTPASDKAAAATGVGRPPAGYPKAPDGAGPGGTANGASATASGDQLTIETAVVAPAFSDPGSPTGYSLACFSGNGPVYGSELIGFCGLISVYDAANGSSRTTTNNTQSHTIYDACGTQVGSGSSFGWHQVGQTYFAGGWVGSQLFTMPTSGVCWGQWHVVYTFTQTFTDGATLTASYTDFFAAYPVAPAPVGGYGVGNGDASVHHPHCSSGDPVNCASGNFSETFVDASVRGRGPGLDLARTYNSLSAGGSGIFGNGWTSSYESHLMMNGDGSVTVVEADGSQATGTPAGGGSYTIPPWADSTLKQNADGTWTFVRRHTTTYTFDSVGRLTAIADLNGYPTRLAYDSSGNLSTVTDAAGRTLTFTFDADGHVSQVADPIGQATSYAYDASGNLTSVTTPLGRTTSFGYDDAHLLTTLTNPRGGTAQNLYDATGRVTQQTDPAGLVTTFVYAGDNFSTDGGTTTITDPHGSVTVQNYTSGVMLSMTKGAGTSAAGTWTYGYDPNTFGLTSSTDPNGHRTTSTYDKAGNVLTTRDALGRTTTFTYNSLNEPLTVTDPSGIVTSYTYDASGNMLTKTVTGAGGSPVQTTTYAYGGRPGDMTRVTDPAGHVTDLAYNAQGDIASKTTHPSSSESNTTTYTYDTLGRKVCETSPAAVAAGVTCGTSYTYDADGERTSTTDPLGNTTSYDYDANGNRIEVTDPAGRVTTTTVDADSRRIAVTAGAGTAGASTTTFAYDLTCPVAIGALYCTSKTDPSGAMTVDYFNARNERVRRDEPSAGTSRSTYDAAGNLATLTTNGGVATYSYDAADRLTSIAYSSPAAGYTAAANVSYAYDAGGRRTSMSDGTGTTTYTYDSLGRLASTTNGAGATVSYAYDAASEITSIRYPGRRQTVTQTWDGAGRQTSVTDWNGNTTSFSYDADGNRTTVAYPNSTTAASTYDASDRVTSTNAGYASFGYTYNAASQLQGETDSGMPGPASQAYGYDDVGRLASSAAGTYSYNTSGDVVQQPAGSQSVNGSHQVTSLVPTISRVGATSAGDAGTGSSLTLQLPGGVTGDDQIVLAVTLPGDQSIKSLTRGYTLVGTYATGTGASDVQLVVYRRTAQDGDAAVTVNFVRSFAKAVSLVVYRGVDPVNPIDVSSSATTPSGTTVVAPSLTTTKAADELVLAAGAASSTAGTWTAPPEMTARVSQAGGATIAGIVADQDAVAAGSTGTRNATFSTTGALAAALLALQPAQSTYEYDSLGNRRSVTTPAGTTTLGYNQLGQMTSYGSTTYTYNGDGLRTAKQVGRKAESFTWMPAGPSGTPLLLVDGGTSYVYGPDGLPLEQISGNTVLYYLHDQLGSTRALTNASGTVVATYTYGAYGDVVGSTGTATSPFGYAGSYTDSESGLLYLQHRYYDPATAQFLAVDPLVDLTASPYAYVGGDPLDQTDPAGLGCHWYNPICQVKEHAHLISTVSGIAAIATAEVPPVSLFFGAVSVTTGGIQTVKDVKAGNWKGVAFDAAALIPGIGAEVQTARLIRIQQEMAQVKSLIALAVQRGDVTLLRRLLEQEAALNNAGRIPDAWAGVLGKTSVGADLAGWLYEGLEC